MNYSELFRGMEEKRAKVGILGANGGFGYSFLAQLVMVDGIILRVLCDLNSNKSAQLLIELGYSAERFRFCDSMKDIEKAKHEEDVILILNNAHLLSYCDIDVLVEATGVPEVSAQVAENCLLGSIHVCMVSKETDSVIGPYLYALAKKNQLVYTIVNGDQPANLVQLISWTKTLGLEIIAAGKSSEYDFIYNPESKEFSYLAQNASIPSLAQTWNLTSLDTLKRRKEILSSYPQSATPDYCEMNVVSNVTGLLPACDNLHYPICRIKELADVFIPKEDGGILEKTNVLDVFIHLRRPDEASFAGGVFVIVSCHNRSVWDLLKEKGHIVSKNGKYACIYLPYHYMGVEAPLTVILAHRLGISYSAGCTRVSLMVGRAIRDFKKGEVLSTAGHHHTIEGVECMLLDCEKATHNAIPFYLAANKTLAQNVSKGSILTFDMIDLDNSQMLRMYQEQTCL